MLLKHSKNSFLQNLLIRSSGIEKQWRTNKMIINYQTADDAVKAVISGHRVFVHGSAATPIHLLKALFNRDHELNHVELISISTLGDEVFNKPELVKVFLSIPFLYQKMCVEL